jgi:hypothetical protein
MPDFPAGNLLFHASARLRAAEFNFRDQNFARACRCVGYVEAKQALPGIREFENENRAVCLLFHSGSASGWLWRSIRWWIQSAS